MTESIKKTTTVLFILRVLRIFLSVITLTISAKFFGVSIERDLWILVTTFLGTLCSAIWGPINETFRAKFIFVKESEGETAAVNQTGSLIGFVVVITVILSILTVVFSENLVNVILSKSLSADASIFLFLLFLLLPTFLINELTSLGISVLNAYNIYYIPEIVGSGTGVISLLVIIFLAPTLGIYSLAVSQYIAILSLLIVVIYQLNKLKIGIGKYLFCIKWKWIKGFIYFSLPFFLPYFFGQCNALTEKWLAGKIGEGVISSLDYAHQFTFVLQGVLSSVLTTIMVPMLSKCFSVSDWDKYSKYFKEYVLICFVLICMIIPFLFGAAYPLCQFFFLRGSITLEVLSHITLLAQLYAISFLGVILYLIFGLALLSSGKGRIYAFWGVIAQLFVLGLNVSFYTIFSTYIFPISLGIGHLLAAIMMGRKIPVNMVEVYINIFRYLIIMVLLSIIFYSFNSNVSLANPFIQLLLNVLILIILLPIIIWGLGINIRPYLNKLIKKN